MSRYSCLAWCLMELSVSSTAVTGSLEIKTSLHSAKINWPVLLGNCLQCEMLHLCHSG